MNNNLKMLLALVIGIAAGVLISRSIREPEPDPFTAALAEIDKVDWKLARDLDTDTAQLDARHRALRQLMSRMGASPIPWECRNRPTKHISKAEALDFIKRYQDGPLQLFTHQGSDLELLKGWFIESDTIQKVLAKHPDANGLQLFLGRKDVPGYDPMTIVWMARHRITGNYCEEDENELAMTTTSETPDEEGTGEGEGEDEGEDVTYWEDAYEYLQPCPPNCPRK